MKVHNGWRAAGAACGAAVGVVLCAALTGFPAQGGVRFAWVAVWALCAIGIHRFTNETDKRLKGCFGLFGSLFVFALALGWRLEAADRTGWDGLLLSLGAALTLGPAVAEAAILCIRCLERMPAASQRNGKRLFWGSLALMLLSWLPALLAFYPGLHAYDTFAQIPEYLSGHFSAHHPLIHTLLVGGLYEIGEVITGNPSFGLLLYSVLQMGLVAFSLAWALMYLRQLRCPTGVITALLALFCLSPQYALHAIGCTKDIPFAALLVLFAVQLHKLYCTPALLKQPHFVLPLLAVGILMCLFRKNAPYALVLTLPFAVALLARGNRLRLTALLLAVLIGSSAAGAGLKAVTHASSGLINEMLCVPAQQLSRVYSKYGTDKPVGYEILENVPYAAKYNPTLADPVKLHLAVQTPQKLLRFTKMWVREFFHFPIEYLDAYLLNTKGYWFLNDVSYAYHGSIFTWFYDNLGVEQHSSLPQLKALYQRLATENGYQRYPLLAQLFQPALYTWLALFGLAWAVWRRDRASTVTSLCLLMYLLTLTLGPVVQNRYSFCITMGAPLLIGLLAAGRTNA